VGGIFADASFSDSERASMMTDIQFQLLIYFLKGI
jgi:hypothetical protein